MIVDRFRSHLCSGGGVASTLLEWQLKQPTRFPFGSGVSATFTSRIITELTMVRFRSMRSNHAGLPLILDSLCGLEFRTFRALLLTVFITYQQRGRSQGLLYAGIERGGALSLRLVI